MQNTTKLNDRASNGRSDDSKQLKWQALKYLLEDPKAMLEPPLSQLWQMSDWQDMRLDS